MSKKKSPLKSHIQKLLKFAKSKSNFRQLGSRLILFLSSIKIQEPLSHPGLTCLYYISSFCKSG